MIIVLLGCIRTSVGRRTCQFKLEFYRVVACESVLVEDVMAYVSSLFFSMTGYTIV